MKLVCFSPMAAGSCVVISIFAVIILSVLAALFASHHESMVGTVDGPTLEAVPDIVRTITVAIFAYLGFIVFCSGQIFFARRNSRRGEIAL